MPTAHDLITSAAQALKDRIEEVNRLNVFPVPDGDTGTNMSLTMDAVIAEVAKTGTDASLDVVCRAVTHGSLMGARGNSGVILSQILRGMCEGVAGVTLLDGEALAVALERSRSVAYQAVRKPVEGTMLTVIRETAEAARVAADHGQDLPAALGTAVAAAFDSVRRTPELLPVLKQNGVVDAGGYGLAILMEGFAAAARGEKLVIADVSSSAAPLSSVAPADDWDDDEYLYCTEFLLFGDDIDSHAVHDYVASVGGSELVVGSGGEYKVHVHTDDPGAVLTHMTALGQVGEVHVNNMRRQKAARDAELANSTPAKPVGFVAVAAGEGLAEVLKSLGVDQVVSGGQTMNPSTQDLANAAATVNADKIVFLPNNKNIVLAASAAVSVERRPSAVVPTVSVPQAFAAMLAYEGGDDLEEIVTAMTQAAGEVRSGEVTTAVRDAQGKAGDISAGQVIGITDGEIEVIGEDVTGVAVQLASLIAKDAEIITLIAGEELDEDATDSLRAAVASALPDADVEVVRGGQPLYPVLISAE